MGTHYSFGIYLDDINELLYVSGSSNGAPECMGEFLLSTLRNKGIKGLIYAMVEDNLELVDREEETIFTFSEMEEGNEWTFSEWIYLYVFNSDYLVVCYPVKAEDSNYAGIIGKNPFGGEYGLYLFLEVPIEGTETLMNFWRRTRSLKREGSYLTLYK